jgi:hypothetical protein
MSYILGVTDAKPSPDELLHYGVKGMRWGVRRSEEELGRAREKRAQKYEKKAAKIDKEIARIQSSKHYTASSKKTLTNAQMSVKTQALEDAKAAREGRLTSDQKRMLKGAAVVGGIVLVVGAYSMQQSGEANRLRMKGKALIEGGDVLKKKPELGGKMSVSELMTNVVVPVNPDYGSPGANMNCRRCTFTYEMRRRGYDVTSTKTLMAHGQSYLGLDAATAPGTKPPKATGVFATLAKAAVGKRNASKAAMGENAISGTAGLDMNDNIFKALRKMPDGARGELGVTWAAGGAHSIAWEIVGGKPVIFDTQVGMKFTSSSDFAKYGSAIKEAAFTRLDNRPLNDEFLLRWMKNA